MPINSASIPALRVARAVRRRKRYAAGGAPDLTDPFFNPSVDLPDVGEPAISDRPFSTGTRFGNRLVGAGGEERFHTWPEKMARSGVTLAGDVLSGRQTVLPPGLRREDYTDTPAPSEPTQDSTWLGQKFGLPPMQAQPNDLMMERAQDMAGMAGGQTLATGARGAAPAAERALVAAADSQATGAPLAALEHAPKFYSGLERAVEAIPQPRMTGEQWLGTLNNRGVKPEEMDWTGLRGFLAERGNQPVTKAQVAEHLGANKLELGEIEKGGATKARLESEWEAAADAVNAGNASRLPERQLRQLRETRDNLREQINSSQDGETKFHSYQLPGGENYREHLLTLPSKPVDMARNAAGLVDNPVSPNYMSSHWDEPNVLVHRRTNERDVNGQRSLHIEEVQSDWHQAGRKQGYDTGPKEAFTVVEGGHQRGQYDTRAEAEAAARQMGGGEVRPIPMQGSGVPDAPFKKNWHDLALKDAIREAAEKGFDRISWTPGEAQAARYDLSKQISSLKATPIMDQHGLKYEIRAKGHGGTSEPINTVTTEAELPNIVGKEMAQKIVDQTGGKKPINFTGLDLKVGGEGMRGFYDKMIPDALNKIGKPHGVKVEKGKTSQTKVSIEKTDDGYAVNNIENPHEYEGVFDTRKEAEAFIRDEFGGDISHPDNSHDVYYMDIPQSLKDQALKKGFSLFEDSAATGAPISALEHVTQTPEFKRWFGDSKAVDAQGNPERFYHGTTSDFETFGPIGSGNQYGGGYYFTKSPKSASNYATGDVNRISPDGNAHPNVMPVYLRYEKPYDRRGPVSAADFKKLEAAANEIEPGYWKKGELVRQFERVYPANGDNVAYELGPKANQIIRKAGFDAFVAPDMTVVFDPVQIKSATGNSGAFSPKNASALLEDAGVSGAPLAGGEHKDQDAAALDAAIALSEKNKPIKKKAAIQPPPERNRGGSVNPAMNVARSIKRAKGGNVHLGPIVGGTDGRADKVPMEVPNGSYVLTADHCSAMGEGNTLSGFEKLKKMFPKSVAAYKEAKARGPTKRASGGNVPILAADGEFIIAPIDILERWGSLDDGHRILDHWQTTERKNHIATLRKLAPPAQD